MALIKLGALAQDVRGSLNGTTFSRNKGGAYVRSKVSPVQPVSAFSANSRQAFKAVSQAWAQLLTDSDRADWIAFAALHPFINVFGDSITLSGVAFYQAAMKRLQQLGFPIYDTPPVTWDVDPPGAIAPVILQDGSSISSLLINPTNPVSGGNITGLPFLTKQIAPGAQPQKTDFRMINDFAANIRDDTYDWFAEYNARFTPYVPPVGSKIGVLYAYLDTVRGAISVASQATVYVAPDVGGLVNVAFYEWADAGGGNADLNLFTETPHGLANGQTVSVTSTPPNVDIDNGSSVVAVIDAYSFNITTGTHAAVPKTATVTVCERLT